MRVFKFDTGVKGVIYNDIPLLLSGEYDLRCYEGLTVEQLTALSRALGLVSQ